MLEFIKKKICRKCHKELTMDMFSPDKRNRDGVRSICKPCQADMKRRKESLARHNKLIREVTISSTGVFDIYYHNRDLTTYIHDLARSRSKNNDDLMDTMIAQAWIRIAFSKPDTDIDALKRVANRAIETERKKHWALKYFEGISFDELLSREECNMWEKGRI
jgi:hypothetical protein